VLGANRERLTDSGARVVEEHEQRVITPSSSGGLIWLSKQELYVFRLEVLRHTDGSALVRQRQDALVLPSARQVVFDKVPEKALDRGQTDVAARDAVATPRLEMRQEGEDTVDFESLEGQRRDCAMPALGEEGEQQA
jgi:hypothetical protein